MNFTKKHIFILGLIIAAILLSIYMYKTHKTLQTHQTLPVPVKSASTSTDSDFLNFDTELSTPDLKAKYVKLSNRKDARHILTADTNPEYMICREKPVSGINMNSVLSSLGSGSTGTATGLVIEDPAVGIYNKDFGCITHKGRADQYNIIETNYQYTWSPTIPKYPMYNICGVDILCLKPTPPSTTLDTQNLYAKQFVYDPLEGWLRPIGSTNFCVATDKETESFVFLAECSDTRVWNKWDCTNGLTEIKLRKDPRRRIAYEISFDKVLTRVFLTDQFVPSVCPNGEKYCIGDNNERIVDDIGFTYINVTWLRDVENQLFKIQPSSVPSSYQLYSSDISSLDYALGVHKVIGTYKTYKTNTDSSTVCQISPEFNDIVNVWSNISYLKKEFNQLLTNKSPIINPFKGLDYTDNKDSYKSVPYYKGPIVDNIYKLAVSKQGFVQFNSNGNIVYNPTCDQQYITLFSFEVIETGNKFYSHSTKINVLIYNSVDGVNLTTRTGLLAYNPNTNKIYFDQQPSQVGYQHIFYVRGTKNKPILFPKLSQNNVIYDFYYYILVDIPDPKNFIFPYDAYTRFIDCWSFSMPRTFPPVNSRANMSTNLIPNYLGFTVYTYLGRYLKQFETKDSIAVGVRNGNSLVISPDGTNPWGLYYLPVSGLSDVTNWKTTENYTQKLMSTAQQETDKAFINDKYITDQSDLNLVELARDYYIYPDGKTREFLYSHIRNSEFPVPRKITPYSKNLAIQDTTNNCLWVVGNIFPVEWESLYPGSKEYIGEIGPNCKMGGAPDGSVCRKIHRMYINKTTTPNTITGVPPGNDIFNFERIKAVLSTNQFEKEWNVDNTIFTFGTSENIWESAYTKEHKNLFGRIYKVPYDRLYKSPDKLLWIERDEFQENFKGMYKIIYKIYKQYRPTKDIIDSSGRTIQVEDMSVDPIPYMFRRFIEITYQNSTITIPLGIRHRSIGIYNDTTYNTNWRDDFGYKKAPIPNIEDLSFIIQNTLTQMSISFTPEVIEYLAVTWLFYMDNYSNIYNMNRLGEYLNYIKTRINKSSWIINNIINIDPSQTGWR
jgi:hypothetical protein